MMRNVKQFRDMGKASFTARLASAVAKDKQLAKLAGKK